MVVGESFKAVESLNFTIECSSKHWAGKSDTLNFESHDDTTKDTATPRTVGLD